jgi:hypothetical protein
VFLSNYLKGKNIDIDHMLYPFSSCLAMLQVSNPRYQSLPPTIFEKVSRKVPAPAPASSVKYDYLRLQVVREKGGWVSYEVQLAQFNDFFVDMSTAHFSVVSAAKLGKRTVCVGPALPLLPWCRLRLICCCCFSASTCSSFFISNGITLSRYRSMGLGKGRGSEPADVACGLWTS